MMKSTEESATHPVPSARAFAPGDEDMAETVRIDADMLAAIDMDLSGTFPPHEVDLPVLPKAEKTAQPRVPSQAPAAAPVDAGVSPLWFVAGGMMLIAAVATAAAVLV